MAAAMSARIVVSSSPGEVRVAVVQGNELVDYALWRPGAPDGVGDLYRGRLAARMPALAGAFVALIGTDGFLPDSEGGKEVTEGTLLGVRVTRAAQGGKGPRLTARLMPEEATLAAAGAVRLVRRGPGPLTELAERYPDAAIETDDAMPSPLEGPGADQSRGEGMLGSDPIRRRPVPSFLSLKERGGWRIVPRAFDDALEAQIDSLADPNVVLANGVRVCIHPTPALTAIDVDVGGAAATDRSKTSHHLAVNRAVLPELARQIRLRNLSGAILVDLAGLPARRRAALGPAIAEALAGDPLKPRFVGFTALGLAEIVRPRVHPPLHELLAGPHAAGLAALRRIAAEVAAHPARVPALRASPVVARALEADAMARGDLARRTGRALILRVDPSLPATSWALEAA
jgi:Ribonuclease E/G family